VQLHLLTGRTGTFDALDLPMELRARLRGIDVVTVPGKDEFKVPAQAPKP
jgi:hypothetical protein